MTTRAVVAASLLTGAAALLIPARSASRPRQPAPRRERAVPVPARRSGRRRGDVGQSLDVDQVARLAERMAALSRAGLAPQRLWPVLADAAAARDSRPSAGSVPLARVAGDVAQVVAAGGTEGEGLRLAAPAPGPLHWVALACDVSHDSGAPMADVLDGLVASLRAEQDAARERQSALAGPRATAAVLTWLPLAGLGLALLTGTNVVTVLLTTTAGRAGLAVGAALWLTGRWWMARMLRQAERPPTSARRDRGRQGVP